MNFNPADHIQAHYQLLPGNIFTIITCIKQTGMIAATTTFWKRTGIQEWFLKKEKISAEAASMTPDMVYKYIIEKFRASIAELSFADRVIFYHEYIICFSQPDYNKFMDNNKGIWKRLYLSHCLYGEMRYLLGGARKKK